MHTSTNITITNIIEILSQKRNDSFKRSFILNIIFVTFPFNISSHIIIIIRFKFFPNTISIGASSLQKNSFPPVQIFPSTVPLNCYPTIQSKKEKKKREIGRKKRKGEDGKFKKQRNSISLKTSVHAAKRLAARSRFC